MSNTIEVTIPDIGDITDAEIIEISVAVGDTVAIEDTLIVLETDKASMDVPSPHAGEVVKIHCAEGDKVGEGAAVLTLKAESDSSSEAESEPAPEDENKDTGSGSDTKPAEESESSSDESDDTQEGEASEEELLIPDLGQDDAVDVIEVMISEGDEIEVDQALVTLETEKASMEVPATMAGKVTTVLIAEGDKVKSGDPVAKILVSGSTTSKVAKAEEPESASSQEKQPSDKSATISSSTVAEKAPVPDYPAMASGPNKGALYASPAIRRFARELGADLTQVKGTGKKGRILKEDVQQFIKYELSRPKATANSAIASKTDLPVIDHSKFGETEEIPLSRIQKVSSVNLTRNWMMIPHVTQHDEADITEMEAFRKEMKAEAMNEGVRLTPLAFLMKGVVASLKAFPRVNSSLANDGENLILKKYFHIGVAVDTPDGLVVPVIRDVDKKSIYELANELAEVSAKAREKKLGMDAMQGGCFSISSLGGIGGTAFTPIVNWPDVAILGVSKSQMKPVWNGDSFEPRLMLPLSLSYDHRVIDGAVAARFTSHLAQTLGDIRRLLLK